MNLPMKISEITFYIWQFPEMGEPKIIHFNMIFQHTPSILGYHHGHGNPHFIINHYQPSLTNIKTMKPSYIGGIPFMETHKPYINHI